jgi:cytochrome P450
VLRPLISLRADRQRLRVFEEHYATKGLAPLRPAGPHTPAQVYGQSLLAQQDRGYQANIAEVTESLLDKCADQGGMDVVDDLASALPVAVLGELMGIPASDQFLAAPVGRPAFGFQGINKPDLDLLLAAQSAIVEIREYLGELLSVASTRVRIC